MKGKEDFFRQITLRICGSLEIEKALWNCLMYLRRFVPADSIYLNIYDSSITLREMIAMADRNGGRLVSIKTSIKGFAAYQKTTRSKVSQMGPFGDAVRGRIFDPDKEREFGISPETRFIQLRLTLEKRFLGTLVIINNGQDYSSKDVDLLALINEPFAVALSNYLRHREVLRLSDHLTDENQYLQDEMRRQFDEEIVGANFGLKGIMEMIRQVAPLASPVLLLGETGTGKEVIARAIHRASGRKDGPIVKVNCGAIPPSLMDSELFGHEKGAFTGALSRKLGYFERAHGGTIFLDEIGELPLEVQVRLLRVLQDKEIDRIGGESPISVDLRVIAATHRNLEAMMAQGRFREDLYYRLRVFPISIPPLRNRLADIPALVQHFLDKKKREIGLAAIPTLSPGAVEMLMNYDWPGNVRELQNAVERALILSRGSQVTFKGLLGPAQKEKPVDPTMREDLSDLSLDAATIRHIKHVLEMTKGRVKGEKGAARLLEVNPSTLRKKMKKLGIPYGRQIK